MNEERNLPDCTAFGDEEWSETEWRSLLEQLIGKGLLTWKDITALTLGHMNPSQVGTSLASSEGFRRRYGKGQVMSKVMEWFYRQDGRCVDCGTRLELQADHIKGREEYNDPLDADFIENMTLRCRRHNVIRRRSHTLGGKTHLTAETALMWILFNLSPRTLTDFTRMCRLYGMTMADIRMQEGWAMAHWLRQADAHSYVIDTETAKCEVLVWPDGGVTRCWPDDTVPDKVTARVLFDGALQTEHLVMLAYLPDEAGEKARMHVFRYAVATLPFSHYFQQDAECLAITYTPPKRKKKSSPIAQTEDNGDAFVQEAELLEEMEAEAEITPTEEVAELEQGGQLKLMPPRGMTFVAAKLIDANTEAVVSWTQRGKRNTLTITRGPGRKVCDLEIANMPGAGFAIE